MLRILEIISLTFSKVQLPFDAFLGIYMKFSLAKSKFYFIIICFFFHTDLPKVAIPLSENLET